MKVRRTEVFFCLLPACSVIGLVFIYPVISLAYYSVMSHGTWETEWVGGENFWFILTDKLFYKALFNNLYLFLIPVILVPVCIAVAVLLYSGTKGTRIYQTIVFFPYMMAVPIVGIILGVMLGREGFVNALLGYIKVGFLAPAWLGNPNLAIFTIAGIVVWKEMGFGILIFFARLLGTDPSLFDAATIDGTTWWQCLWYVMIPELSVVLKFYFLISTINALSWLFAYVYVLTGGGPSDRTSILSLYIYRLSFQDFQVGTACAASVVLLGIAAIIIIFLQSQLRIKY